MKRETGIGAKVTVPFTGSPMLMELLVLNKLNDTYIHTHMDIMEKSYFVLW